MAVSPYDQAAWSTYTPLSSQEILQPALMMRERHDRLDEEYAAIDDELQKIAFIAETENDPAIQQMYNNYTKQLESGMNELMERGVTPNSRRRMLGVRSRFQSQIAPIRQAYELKQQDINQINQMKMKDPTFIGPDPTQRSLTDYLASGLQPMGHQGISGALLTQMANQYLALYSQELTDTDLDDLLLTIVGEEKVPQYREYIKKYGYKPGTEEHRALMEAVSNRIMESTGIRAWANEDQLRQAQGYINMAETATIGKDQSQVLNDNAFGLAVQKQAAKEAAEGIEARRNRTATRLPGTIEMTNADRTMVDDFNKQYGTSAGNRNRILSTSNSFEEYLDNMGIDPKTGTSSSQSRGTNPSVLSNNTTDLSKWDFNVTKAAFEIKDQIENLSEQDKERFITELFPEESSDFINRLLLAGTGGYVIAARTALERGVPWETIVKVGKNTGVTALPLLAGKLFTSPSDPQTVNRDNLLKELDVLTSPIYKQFGSLKNITNMDGVEYSEEELLSILNQDIENRSIIASSPLKFNDNTLYKEEERDAYSHITDIRNSGGIIKEVDSKGKRKIISANNAFKELDKDITNNFKNAKYIGHSPINPHLNNMPSYNFIITMDNKDYHIEVPAQALSQDYATFRNVYETINRGVSEPTVVNTPTGPVQVVPQIIRGQLEYMIVRKDNEGNNVVFPLEALISEGTSSAANRLFNLGATRSEYK